MLRNAVFLVCRPDAEEVTSLPGKVSETERQDSNQEHVDIVDQALVPSDVPAEVIPAITAPVAFVRCPESLPDISFSHVDRRRNVEQDADAFAASTAPRHAFDVLGVPGPHLTKLFDQRHSGLCQ